MLFIALINMVAYLWVGNPINLLAGTFCAAFVFFINSIKEE
jgi:protein-S-isoprenylcysteine O-methyltransferase Ste14